ncbi:hypothetical protein BGZ70_006234 [Mortierella alpina]|uniref:Uncharacterized protein n=1 Tax=Mortierella alpina TaxID=64518 RepID=A0A9P6LU14_MORAP|nr:hypothetical protein BGZ70_006234 [Mortierella alpina]
MTIQGIRGYLEYLREDRRRELLFDFYLSRWYLRKQWDMRKAQEASYDYAIKSIMGLGDASDCTKRDESKPNVIFAVGLGSFNSQTGLPSKHGALIRKLVIRARSLGYCQNCEAYFDRDHVGSENIGILCQTQILQQQRPDKFKPIN